LDEPFEPLLALCSELKSDCERVREAGTPSPRSECERARTP
jgi:hypothetical protein